MMHGDKPDNRRAAEMRGRVLAAVRRPAAADLDEALATLQQVWLEGTRVGWGGWTGSVLWGPGIPRTDWREHC